MGVSLSKHVKRVKKTNGVQNGSSSPSAASSGGGVRGNNKFLQDSELEAADSTGAASSSTRNYNVYSVDPANVKTDDAEDGCLKDHMRHQLASDSQIFVLNQVLLGVHFFANYDIDIEHSKDRVRTEQNIKSDKIRQYNKSVMLTNELSDAIDQSVIFQMRHGPRKSLRTNLFSHKLYIVHDNVEITSDGSNDSSTYSSMNYQPSYRLEFDKKYRKRSGYVRLRFCDRMPTTNPDIVEEVMSSEKNDSTTETSNSSTSNNTHSSSFLDEDVIKVIKKDNLYNSHKQQQQQQQQPQTEYDYTYMASYNERRPLMTDSGSNSGSGSGAGGSGASEPASAAILPEECITEIKRTIIVSTDTFAVPDNNNNNSNNLEDKFQYVEKRGQYLNSKSFMHYFKRIFKETISKNLDFDTDQLMNATWKGASIYCPVTSTNSSRRSLTNHYEIIPAIACPWPSEAIEAFNRKRHIITGRNLPNHWMSDEMINRIFDLNCHAIPIGYVSRRAHKSNKFSRSLEWKIVFPDAERYLESRLTDCQLKVYILAKVLYKTYIEPLNYQFDSAATTTSTYASQTSLDADPRTATAAEKGAGGPINFITDEHLRAHLFMQCELNTIRWSEFNLGGNLLEFLKTFLQRVQTKTLPDFFLPKRNLFEPVPEPVIIKLHECIFRIIENPIMYVMMALKNVRFVKNFYPRLNLKRLYTILTIDEPLALVNPRLYQENEQKKKQGDDESDGEEELNNDAVLTNGNSNGANGEANNGLNFNYPLGNMGAYYMKVQQDLQKRRNTKQLQFEDLMKLKKLESNRRRESLESINTEIIINRHMTKYRRKATYEIFVRQFLQLGRKCLEYENHKFLPIYIGQAQRLTDLLREDHFEIDAQELHGMVCDLKMQQKHPDSHHRQQQQKQQQHHHHHNHQLPGTGSTQRQVNGTTKTTNSSATATKTTATSPVALADKKRRHVKKVTVNLSPTTLHREIWRNGQPSSPTQQFFAPVSFLSPDLGHRKSILRNPMSPPLSPIISQQQHEFQFTVDVHSFSPPKPIIKHGGGGGGGENTRSAATSLNTNALANNTNNDSKSDDKLTVNLDEFVIRLRPNYDDDHHREDGDGEEQYDSKL